MTFLMVRIHLQKVAATWGYWGQRSEILHGTLYGQYKCHIKIQAQSEKKNKFLDTLVITAIFFLEIKKHFVKLVFFPEFLFPTHLSTIHCTFLTHNDLDLMSWFGGSMPLHLIVNHIKLAKIGTTLLIKLHFVT